MAHVLILGMTESGKTTLAKKLAARYRAQGQTVLVLDPLRDPSWPCDFITSDQDHFLEVFWANKSCMAFLDEGGESVGRYDRAMQKTATRGRHPGHSCHYIAQEATQLAPIVRGQCRHLFLFCSPVDSGKVLAREFNRPELLECSTLLVGEYIHAVKMGSISFNRRSSDAKHSDASGNRSGRTRDGDGPRATEGGGTEQATGEGAEG